MVDKTPEALASHIAPRIRQAIQESGMTLELVGDSVGVSKNAVAKWRKFGQITLPNLWKLSECTGKPMAWFFPGYIDADVTAQSDAQLLGGLLRTADEEFLESLLLEVLTAKRSRTD